MVEYDVFVSRYQEYTLLTNEKRPQWDTKKSLLYTSMLL